MSERQERVQDPRQREWTPLLLSIGFSLSDLVGFALQIDNTRVAKMVIRNVQTLLASGCEDEHQWRDAMETLDELIRAHPDRHQESGTWIAGAPTILALGAAREAARAALYRLYPSLHTDGEIEGTAFKAFKYLLRAWAQDPKTSPNGLEWVERALNLRYAKG